MIRSLEQILNSDESETLKNLLKKKKKELEKDYNKKEQIKDDFLFTMLSKGYINEEYRFYIESNDKVDTILNIWERLYLNIVKDELNPNFALKIKHDKLVAHEIRDYQWSSPSILNNNILTFLILHDLPNQVNWFINAILNYFEKYQQNDFVDQYVESINSLDNKNYILSYFLEKIYKKLLLDTSSDIKLKILLSVFSTYSGPLFCNFLINNFNSNDNFTKLLNNFFENRQSILQYTLDKAKVDVILDSVLSEINLEIEKLSIYSYSTQKLLIDNAMFQISKENLDYLMKQNAPPHSYYDYIRNKSKLKKKIFNSKDIEKFVNEILLAKDKLYISKEGIVDLLFTTLIEDDIAEKVTAKLDNEFIDLTYVPKFCKDNTTSILALNTSLFHTLIEQNKIKVDFNNVLYLSSSCTAEDTILFAQKQINKQVQNISLYNIDTFAKNHFLSSFYSFLLTEQKVSLDLFEKESDFLILQGIDILELIDSSIKEEKNITILKIQKLIDLSFERINYSSNISNKTFSLIIKNNFDYFYDNFEKIKSNSIIKRSKLAWIVNLSVLLKNEFDILKEEHLNSVIKIINIDDFKSIIKEWSNNIGIYNTSKIVEKLFNKTCIETWLNNYGKKEITNFINSINIYLDYETEYKLIAILNSKQTNKDNPHINDIIKIAYFYNLSQESIIYYKSTFFHDIINELQKGKKVDWDKINNSIIAKFKNNNFDYTINENNLFILGRYFYNAIESGNILIKDYLDSKNILLYYSKHSSLDSFLCGTIFEAYFDYEGNLKKITNKLYFDQLLNYFENKANSSGVQFIQSCINLFKDHFIYIPKNPDIIFKVNGNIIDNDIEINSITCDGVEILTKPQNDPNMGILPVTGSKDDMIMSIRGYFTIPKYRIKLEPSFENYIMEKGLDFIQPLSSIVPLINKMKKHKF